jgi:5-methylcytosine-specific restriction endonuclease McrA
MLKCTKCKIEKSFSDFSRCKRSKTGYQSSCKQCKIDYREANREGYIDYHKKYREQNKERISDVKKKSVEKNKAHYLMLSKKYREENKERMAAYKRNFKARSLGAEGKHTHEDVLFLLKSQGHCCAICKQTLHKYHVDHVIPISKGGSNNKDNLQILCRDCNMSKYNKDPIEYIQSLGYLI